MKKVALSITAMCALVLAMSSCNGVQNADSATTSSTEKTSESKKESDNEDACMKPVSAEDSAKYHSTQISVKGDIEFPLTLTVDSLKKMKTVTIKDFKVVCQSGANMKDVESCKGVLLRDILDKAKIVQNNHKDRNFYIVARSTDNYMATFSWAEIFNNPTGENVYVLFEENGKPIKSQGDFILICKNDIKTGPRHVYWLNSIEVNRVK